MRQNPEADSSKQNIVIVERRSQGVYWVIALFLAVLTTVEVLKWDDGLWGNVAFAQNVARAGAGGVFAFSGQISRNTYGVFMVDVDAGTIWAYEIEQGKMKLIAARSWYSDRHLEEFNIIGPSPKDIDALVSQQRQMRLKTQTGKAAAPDAPR